MSYQNLLTERIDKVALITLNRPEKLNALSYELACEIDEELKNIGQRGYFDRRRAAGVFSWW